MCVVASELLSRVHRILYPVRRIAEYMVLHRSAGLLPLSARQGHVIADCVHGAARARGTDAVIADLQHWRTEESVAGAQFALYPQGYAYVTCRAHQR